MKLVRPKDIADHPAEYSEEVLDEFVKLVPRGVTVLDPMAGTGWKLATALEGRKIVGIELEPEWADAHPCVQQGNALHLPFKNGRFRWVVTSPVYGNRMSDHHDAKEKCKPCGGTGQVWEEGADTPLAGQAESYWRTCEKCGGEGKRKYKRITYKHYLGRDLHPDNAGQLQWGDAYRVFHEAAWREVYRVTRKGDRPATAGNFLLNIKDHVRGKEMQPVTQWHIDTLTKIGFTEIDRIPVFTDGMGFGANRDARAEHEWVIHFAKVA
jgi:hypothetical protein